MNFLDDSNKVVIEEPIKIGSDDSVTKYRAESDGRTFWAYNGMEVFYENERMYEALDEIARLKKFKESAQFYAQKFVNKVESGRARSVETYADMKKILEQ